MNEERFSVFIDSLEPDSGPLLRRMEEEADRDRVPILRRETASFLCNLIRMAQPASILEIGTAIGYSALRMSEACPNARITTLELDPVRGARARYYFREAGCEDKITARIGDAAELLPTLAGPYDFIFLDGPKGQYLNYLPELLRLLAPGGCLLADNVLREGTLLESRYAVTRRDRTIHERMREFVYRLYHEESLTSSLLPLEDGVLLSIKKKVL